MPAQPQRSFARQASPAPYPVVEAYARHFPPTGITQVFADRGLTDNIGWIDGFQDHGFIWVVAHHGRGYRLNVGEGVAS